MDEWDGNKGILVRVDLIRPNKIAMRKNTNVAIYWTIWRKRKYDTIESLNGIAE